MKKTLIFLGVVSVTLLMILSVTAVPNASAKSIIEQFEKTEENNKSENIFGLTEYTPYTADKEPVLNLQDKLEQFLAENKLTVNDYKNSEIYNSPEFQNLINRGEGFNNEMLALNDQLNYIIDEFSEIWSEELLKETLFHLVEDYFEELILSTEFEEFIDTFEDTIIRPLAYDMSEVFDEEDTNIGGNSDNELGSSTSSINFMGYVLEQILIAVCTVVYFIGFCSSGHNENMQSAVQFILTVILGAAVVIPACLILISDVIVGNAQVAFSALLTSVVVLVSVMGALLYQAVYEFGIIGFMIWVLGFMVNLPLIPVELFIIFLVKYFDCIECEVGYVINHLGPFVNEILSSAAENAKDLYDNIWGSKGSPKNRSKPLFLTEFFEKVLERFRTIERLFSKGFTDIVRQ